jgi:hypothetical protein
VKKPEKNFDVMKWLRKVRDDRAARQEGMSHEQKLEETRAGTARFRASVARRKKTSKK